MEKPGWWLFSVSFPPSIDKRPTENNNAGKICSYCASARMTTLFLEWSLESLTCFGTVQHRAQPFFKVMQRTERMLWIAENTASTPTYGFKLHNQTPLVLCYGAKPSKLERNNLGNFEDKLEVCCTKGLSTRATAGCCVPASTHSCMRWWYTWTSVLFTPPILTSHVVLDVVCKGSERQPTPHGMCKILLHATTVQSCIDRLCLRTYLRLA